ncbi:Flavin-containing monooxygenase [Handroanthus impetiginosus]|uniref:Flavin-containing monooxygenase n=1 Tax=Handroanthus impetiginosus TaxID=429701 RepID=A0A2G9HTM3_9LAMI|nr:Flavin-containing monooxygenase [Handroanthus impetiginosus]
MAPPLTVAVIGAGVAGLATASALKVEGHRVIVYEKSNRLGGTWVYDPRVESDSLSLDPNREIVHSSLYQSLCTNLPRQLMGFLDYPFATRKYGDLRTFPGHEEVLGLLNEFASEFGLVELIRFETEVVRVERVDLRNDKWVVESRSGTNELGSEEVFDAVVVCNGHHTQPSVADFPGMEKWPGKQMHSHNYRVPEPFQDQIVVVIGDGPSAKDISQEISKVAKEVHLSSRSLNIKISKLEYGDNMWQHSEIDHVDENGEVAFQDGASVHADIILHCTGFKYDFPFLKTEGIVAVDDNRVGPLYKHLFPPELAPSLSFVGLPYYPAPVFLMMDLQAKWIAHVLSGKVSLPSKEEMLADVQEYYQTMAEKGIPKHHTHSLGHEFEYSDWLAAQVGLPRVDEQTRLMHKSYFKFISDNGFWRKKEWQPGYRLQQEEL